MSEEIMIWKGKGVFWGQNDLNLDYGASTMCYGSWVNHFTFLRFPQDTNICITGGL